MSQHTYPCAPEPSQTPSTPPTPSYRSLGISAQPKDTKGDRRYSFSEPSGLPSPISRGHHPFQFWNEESRRASEQDDENLKQSNIAQQIPAGNKRGRNDIDDDPPSGLGAVADVDRLEPRTIRPVRIRKPHGGSVPGETNATMITQDDDMLADKNRRRRAAPPGRCHTCNAARSPDWRRGPDGSRTLCNTCGLHYAILSRKQAINSSTPLETTPPHVAEATLTHTSCNTRSPKSPSPSIESLRENDSEFEAHGIEEIRRIVLEDLLETGTEHSLGSPKEEKQSSVASQSFDGSTRYSTAISVHWDMRTFIKTQFGELGTTALGSVITLTGTALHAQATTVKEYVKLNWPATGLALLELLQKTSESGRLESEEYSSLGLELWGYQIHTTVAVHVNGPALFIVSIAQQLAWLGSALRTSDTKYIGRSQAQLVHLPKTQSPEVVWFELHFRTDLPPDDERICWHDLFFNPVIAYNFPIPKRGEEVGLEIPIEMMASLGGASHAVEYEGGIVMKGFSSMFVPLRRSRDCIQWHYITNKDDSRLEYWQADKRCPGRALLDSVDHQSLKSTRAFLGWWGETTTHLGAEDINYGNLDWSATKEPDRSATFSGGTIGFQNFATGELSFAVGPKDSKLHIARTGSYHRIIKHASRTPAVLYDTCEKRGWLVPSSAVIAHIAQTRHFRERFSIDGKPVSIIPTDPTQNVYEAAERMLLINASTKLEDCGVENSVVYFRDLVQGIWSLLEAVIDKDIEKEVSTDPAVRVTTRKALRGWEFMDVVDEMSPIRQKETIIKKTCGDWPDLAQDINAVVLFASGFENIIKPAEAMTKGLCHLWRTMPQGNDYLAASVPILNSLYEKAGSRLTKQHLTSTHLRWHRGLKLFENCEDVAAFRCSCDRLQRIVRDSLMSFGPINPPEPLEEQGAVIFGQIKHSLKEAICTHQQTKTIGIYSQENVPLVVQTNPPDSPDPASPSYCGSPSLPRLGSGTTLATSLESDNEGDKECSEYTDVENLEALEMFRALKRSRDDSEKSLCKTRKTLRQRMVKRRTRKMETGILRL